MAERDNPFTLDFGREPSEMIPRITAMEELIQVFTAENPSQHIALISGIRGCGKTVFMSSVCRRLEQQKGWTIVELTPEQDLLRGLVVKLGNEKKLSNFLQRMKVNLSYFGVSLSVEGNNPITDAEIALERIFESIRKHHQRVLIAIDEVINSQNMRIFASVYQMLLRKDYPVFLLMTGLYENIRRLQDEKTLTFLYRAPRIALPPLNLGIMADSYQRIFQQDRESALRMAKMTRGYSFAFQVLGYFTWMYPKEPDRVRSLYRQYLEEYVYEKVWSELSGGDRRVIRAIAQVPSGEVKKIREVLGMETNQFNPYRMRLIRKGIVNGDEYGMLRFTLPLFEQFVQENYFSDQATSVYGGEE